MSRLVLNPKMGKAKRRLFFPMLVAGLILFLMTACGEVISNGGDGDLEAGSCNDSCLDMCDMIASCSIVDLPLNLITDLCDIACNNPPADLQAVPVAYLGCSTIEDCEEFESCLLDEGLSGFSCNWDDDQDGDMDDEEALEEEGDGECLGDACQNSVLLADETFGKDEPLSEQWTVLEMMNHEVEDGMLVLWTPLGAPPYYGAAQTVAHRMLDATPSEDGTVQLVATFKWAEALGDESNPLMTIGLANPTTEGEAALDDSVAVLLQIFETGSGLSALFGLTAEPLEVGVWYELNLEVGTDSIHAVIIKVEDSEVKLDATVDANDYPVNPDLGYFQFSIQVDDTQYGEARILLDDVHIVDEL